MDAVATIWDAVESYEYADEHKEELVNALVELKYIAMYHTHLERDHERLGINKEAIRIKVLDEWNRRVEDSE
jgi:hypothetical protein